MIQNGIIVNFDTKQYTSILEVVNYIYNNDINVEFIKDNDLDSGTYIIQDSKISKEKYFRGTYTFRENLILLKEKMFI